ncbi:MAG: hypothetical protein LBQ74_03815 [Prevotella sp.]|jgi:hypothetical protein|nr:hypothetical protein [Prevotella sp.]
MINEFSEITGVSVDAILGRSRKENVAIYRAVYWWLLREAGFLYPEIGRMNGRSHSAIYTAVKGILDGLSVGDKQIKTIVDKTKHLKYKYMSNINRSVHISAPSKSYDLQKETFIFENIKCEYCNGEGGFVRNEASYSYDPAKGIEFIPCKVCKGAKKVKAIVSVVWEPDGDIIDTKI